MVFHQRRRRPHHLVEGLLKNQFTFTLSDGSPVKGNVGPTFIALIDSSMEESMKLDPEE